MGSPVKYTCPDINAVIDNISEIIIDLSSDTEDETPAGLQVRIDNAVNQLTCYTSNSAYDNPLEQLRNSNSELRDWGYKMECQSEEKSSEIIQIDQRCDILEEENIELKQRILELESQLESADSLIRSLEKITLKNI